MNNADIFIDIIDKRIDSYVKNARIVCRFVGKVVGLNQNQSARVKIIGFDTIFVFPYRDYLIDKIQEGDSVYIESKIGNLSNGIITDRFYGQEGE